MIAEPVLSQLRAAAAQRTEAVAELARRICEVPAPTGNEGERARLVASLWRERGYTPEIDAVGNVYVRRGKPGPPGQRPVLMLLAHTDTVFPQTSPIVVRREGDVLRGPGIGDNSVNVGGMIGALDILDELGIETAVDIIAVADVGEEGLGNLLGARTAVERYHEQLGAVISVDGSIGRITHAAVGSKRWRIIVRGPGGHSYGAFGTPSAIHGLGRIITAIADMQVPQQPKTTFNVGIIEGGTSVNTIAARASALLDMRSTDVAALNHLADEVRVIVEQRAGSGLQTEIEVLGERPAGQLSRSSPLVQLAADALSWLGIEPKYGASSTDANIPISLGIPAICIGITRVEGAHTLQEFLTIPPIADGLAQLTRLCVEASSWLAE
ncbi:MAG TPA: M20/M25/M40 family metallo-hydrolase [Ktedonobacteraceae bacterium]|nr:M20/M25/M40 family metallo-hydrolase [Ktedonobacteraceae bacterium]